MKVFVKKIKEFYLVCNYICICVWAQLSPMVVNASNAGAEAIKNSFGNLYDIMAAFMSSVGSIYVLWGVFEISTSLQSPNGGEQAQAFRKVGGGLLATLGPAIMKGLIG